jgi:hypothetical protein
MITRNEPLYSQTGDALFAPWLNIVRLAFESNEVIGLRLAKLAAGGINAQHETHLMVGEKVGAVFEAGISLLSGTTPTNVIDRFRTLVAANARRLSAEHLDAQRQPG